MFVTNVTSYFLLTKYALPYLIESKGIILNNASVAGLQSNIKGRSYAYSSAKSAVIQFSRACALNYGKDVRINCICPGVIDTPMYINKNFDRYMSDIPVKRVGTPEDVAKAALFLCSDLASYVHGAVLTVDGGFSL
jgi:NAD(P)-dependent dehydrogenase (short-subunit alcohol dehydrogenase family)